MSHPMNRRVFLRTSGALAAGVACTRLAPWPSAAAESPQGALASEKLGWRLACCAYSFNKLTFYETIVKVASLGLSRVVGFTFQRLDPANPGVMFNEAMSPAKRQETKKRLADAGVQVVSCYSGGLIQEGATRRLFEFAREMGIENIDGEPPLEAFDMLEKLCDEYGINLAVHNHAKPTPYWMPETLVKVFSGRSKRIGACCDTGHWARSGLDPIETLTKLQGRILTFDLKDVDEKGICVPFGTGKGRVGDILAELHRQGFCGVIGLEYDQHPPEIEKELVQCIRYVENVAERLSAR